MEKLTNEELLNINGGGINVIGGLVIGAIVSFLVGILDGYLRPLKCK